MIAHVPQHASPWAKVEEWGERWAGFSLEKRAEWRECGSPRGCWRARILPNKQERQHMKLTAYGATAVEAIANLHRLVIETEASG